MGMNEKSGGGGGNAVFLNPINHPTSGDVHWARRVAKGVEGSTPREAKCGLVHELYYESLDGMIKSMRIVDKGQYGEDLEIGLHDGDQLMLLQTGFSSDIGKAIICRLEGINPELEIEIGVCTIENDKGEKKRFAWMKQGDDKILNRYSRKDGADESELQLPQPVEKKKARGGGSDWDWEDHDNALFEICRDISIANGWAKDEEEFVESSFKHAEKAEKPAEEGEMIPPSTPVDEDDIPF